MTQKQGKRFPLLVYDRLGKRWSRLGLLLTLFSGALLLLLILVLRLEFPPLLRYLTPLPLLAGIVLLLFGLLTRRVCYVQCTSRVLRIQAPIYHLLVSYRRIKTVRPVQVSRLFDPQKEKAARRLWPNKYWSMTALVVEIPKFPVSERWLRLWLDRYLFWQEGTGFVLLVEDWMGLSQQLDSARSAYRAQLGSRQPPSRAGK